MQALKRHIILLLACMAFWTGARAQKGIFIPPGAHVFLASDTAGFFADVMLQGTLGISRNAVVHFAGRQWTNTATARITDENRRTNDSGGYSGLVRFAAPLLRQQLSGGYNAATRQGPTFARINVHNASGLVLVASASKVTQTLGMEQGLVWLNGQTLVVGHRQPGIITGYSDTRFLVTGTSAGSGTLVREGLTNRLGPVVFPVGTSKEKYAPIAVRLLSDDGDDFSASVFDQVRTGVHTGFLLADQTVNTTWELGKLHRPGEDAVQVTLQHQLRYGGEDYLLNQDRAFVSFYRKGNWDTIAPSAAGKGILVSGPAVANAASHTRFLPNGIEGASYFTKMALPDTNRRMTLDLYGYRIDANYTHIGWGVQPEKNVHSYIVQRWFPNNRGYEEIDTLPTQASNRLSTRHLYYQTTDPNSFTGITYYRLRIRYFDGSESYSEPIAIAGLAGKLDMHLWPNPTPDNTFVSISTAMPVHKLVIWDMAGKKLFEEPINGRRIIQLNLKPYSQSMFVVGIISPAGKLLASEKVMKLQH